MWLAYPFVVFGGITATVLSAPIINDGGHIARTEQESTRVAARVLIPIRIAPEAPRRLCDRNPPPPLEKRGNGRIQELFRYSDYDDNLEKWKRQDDFGYSSYDDQPEREKRKVSPGYDRPEIAKRQDSFGYSDYDDNPEKSKRQDDFGYSSYDDQPKREKRKISSGYDIPAIAKRQDDFGYSDYDSSKPNRERRQFGYSSYTPLDKSQREKRQKETSAEAKH
ncbi:hypothetical protein EMPG_17801 [Blastomyces silverae]|uniref:Uncharacterized protein n=1 Tax=Blastomyces silverae TaxID=2060906 RepID=A0A0H1B5M3_9EURO|nr:hypothetical protein EMPG_17801 [Blastomyces silverae]